mgnify:CR=1 FL=1
MHSLIVGRTESGKTTLAKILAAAFVERGKDVAILDPLLDPGWEGTLITKEPTEFLHYVKTNKGLILFVDESGSMIGRYNPEMDWLATSSRHMGHSVFFICQRAQQISLTIRAQCSKTYLFASIRQDAEYFADEYNEPTILTAPKMIAGEFYILSSFQQIRKACIDFRTRSVKIVKVGRSLQRA